MMSPWRRSARHPESSRELVSGKIPFSHASGKCLLDALAFYVASAGSTYPYSPLFNALILILILIGYCFDC